MRIKNYFKNPNNYIKLANFSISLYIVWIILYLVISPFYADVKYAVAEQTDKIDNSLVKNIADTVLNQPEDLDANYFPQGRHVVIPKIKSKQEIQIGSDSWLLSKGPWKIPDTSTPAEGSNTVIAAHRFIYGDDQYQKSFYHLDKLGVGDEIFIFWDDVKYVYTVKANFKVDPTAIEIEDPTEESILTLYTCTPIISSTYRLIVQADLTNTITREDFEKKL